MANKRKAIEAGRKIGDITTNMTWEVFHIRESERGKTKWTRIGEAFPNRDSSICIYLDVLPPNGRMLLRNTTPGGL